MDDQRPGGTGGGGAASLARAIDATGGEICRALRAARRSTVFSPASIAIALQMALRGARGTTAVELARFLHMTDTDVAGEALRELSAGLAGAAEADDTGVTFRMPNTMWVQSGLGLVPEFAAWMNEVAQADVRDADFFREPEKARLEINRFIAQQTAGKITNIIQQGLIDPGTRLVLTNAVYLKASWAHPFPERATRDAPFHPDAARTATVRMMHVTAPFGYLRGDGYQAVTLPYAGTRLAMTVVLPDGPLAPLEARLASGGLASLTEGTRSVRVALAMPKFRVTTGFQLGGVLRDLGVRAAFGDDADFSGITTAERLRIREVVHKAYIDVDEKGTEAAAATAVIMRVAALAPDRPPVTVTLDRPFLFAITDTVTGLPVFLGTQTDPAAG